MIFLNPGALAAALREDTLNERTKFRLLLLGSGLQFLFGQSAVAMLRSDAQLVVVLAVIMVWGITACFKANARGDGRAFLERYVCLSTSISIYTTILYFVVAYAQYRFRGTEASIAAFVWFGLSAALYLLSFVVLRFYVAIAAGSSARSSGA